MSGRRKAYVVVLDKSTACTLCNSNTWYEVVGPAGPGMFRSYKTREQAEDMAAQLNWAAAMAVRGERARVRARAKKVRGK